MDFLKGGFVFWMIPASHGCIGGQKHQFDIGSSDIRMDSAVKVKVK